MTLKEHLKQFELREKRLNAKEKRLKGWGRRLEEQEEYIGAREESVVEREKHVGERGKNLNIEKKRLEDLRVQLEFFESKKVAVSSCDVLNVLSNQVTKIPILFPNFQSAMREFAKEFDVPSDYDSYFETNYEQLQGVIRKTFERCSFIIKWSHIDLDILARNVTQELLINEEHYETISR